MSAAPNATTTDGSGPLVQGWVHQPEGRGTFDIIMSCLVTIFLCSWSVLVLHVPFENQTPVRFLLRKAKWMIFTIIFPEMLTGLAAEQWRSARQSVEDFGRLRKQGLPPAGDAEDMESQTKRRRHSSIARAQSSPWTLRHAFFADMGGFVLQCPDHPPFAVDAHQLFFLVDKGYLDYPNITSRQIWDKNKADGFARAVTLVQITWFTIQAIARAFQHLAITSFELSILGMIFCTVNAMFFWQHKPLDVETPIALPCSTPLRTILDDHGERGNEPEGGSPLEFIRQRATCITMVQPFCWAVALCFDWRAPLETPRPTIIPNTQTIPPRGLRMVDVIYGVFFTQAYLGIHLAGWNFIFPTPVEQVLWRVSSLVLQGLVVFYLLGLAFGTVASEWLARTLFHVDGVKTIVGVARLLPRWIGVAIHFPILLAYGLARTYILAEGFSGLRSLPATAFLNVNWTQFFPHF